MATIDLKKVRSEQEKRLQNDDIIKQEFKSDRDEKFEEYRRNAKEEYSGRAKFNGKLLAIIAAVILIIFFIIYMSTTSISDVVEKKTGESVISSDAKSFIIDLE